METIAEKLSKTKPLDLSSKFAQALIGLPVQGRSQRLERLLKACNIVHSKEYIFNPENHAFIIHQIEQANKHVPEDRSIKINLVAYSLALVKMATILHLIQLNQKRAQREIFANSLEARQYIEKRLISYYQKLTNQITIK